jgi:CMP-N-acetylneuraminic acid synthetase/GT2 family glycosyltransferase
LCRNNEVTMTTSVSIIITAHNYAKFLPKALDSAQSYEDLEVVVVNDGSTDDTETVLAGYAADPRLKVITLDGVGLAAASNRGIEASGGDYIVRLDADDWFDENLVLVLASYLDRNLNVGLVFCDYFTVDAHGELIQTIRRAKTNDEVELLDRPCLAAGAMYRRTCFEAIGGYNESIRYQEDYDFWIKFIEKFQVHNVSLPLMYYRQHASSMSTNRDARMRVRREVKRKFVSEHRDEMSRRVLAVIPARADMLDSSKFLLLPLGERSLLEHCIDKLKNVDMVERVIVSTEDAEIAEHAKAAGAEVPILRSRETISPRVTFGAALKELLDHLDDTDGYQPDIIVLTYPHSPFIDSSHVSEAIDSLLIYDTDSVIAVVEDQTYHWMIGKKGLTPVGYQERVVRQDKDLVFKEAGGLYVIHSHDMIGSDDMLGHRIGHIELSHGESLRINGPWEYQVAQYIVGNGLKK